MGGLGSQHGSPSPPREKYWSASSSGTPREKGLVIGGSPSSPTSQPKPHCRESLAPQAELEPSHSRDNTGSSREPLSTSCHRENGAPHGNLAETGEQEQQRCSLRLTDRRGQPYEVCQDDLLDQHVAYYLRHHPEIHSQHSIYRLRPGVYALDRREVHVEWQHAETPVRQGFLVIVDGPLRQPFADYMQMTDNNAEYDSESCNRSSLHSIPKEQRMSFRDHDKVYTRLEAMKVAKEQAAFREKHADYIKEGVEVPDDLMMKYKKTVQQKLGQQTSQRSDHGSTSPHGNTTPPEYVMTPPPEQLFSERGVRASYTPQNVFASEPMDYFDGPGGGSSMWNTVWGATGASQRSVVGLAPAHNYGEGDRHVIVTPPVPPPSWQQNSVNRNTAWSGFP